MPRVTSRPAVRAALALLAIATLLAIVFVLRALPATDLPAAGLNFVLPTLATGLMIAAGIGTVASLTAGLRHGSLAALLLAGAAAALVGGSVILLTGSTTMTLSIVSAGALVLGASIAERLGAVMAGRAARVATAGVLLAVAEAMGIAELVPVVAGAIDPLRPWLIAGAAALGGLAAATAAVRDLGPAAAALAVGAMALAVSRGPGAELALALVALTGAALLVTRSMLGAEHEPRISEPLPPLALHLTEGVLRFDGHLKLRSWNPAASAVLGLDDASAGTGLEDLLGVSLAQLPAGSEAALHRTSIGGLELSIHREPNAITVVIHDQGTSTEADSLGRELRGTIAELLQARRTVELQRGELERAASTDPLTGVASRGAILERLRIEVAQARRYDHPIAMLLLDVDRFGEINSTHGIEGGDAVLREIALRARLRVRAADALGRSGSDGLLAILPHTDEGGAATFADVLRRRIGQRPVLVRDIEVAVTLSVGVAVMRPGEDLDFDGLMIRAEEALASARSAGGDRIALDRMHGLARLTPPDEAASNEGA